MNCRHILVVIILIIAAIFFKSRISKSTEIERTGNKISIISGKHKITAYVTGYEKTDSFLVFGGSGNSDLDFTTPFSVIPLHTANLLAQRYGNFFKCASPGAPEAKRNIKSLFLYPANKDVERSIKSIDKLTMNDKNPVIKMTYVELMIADHKFKRYGEEVQFNYYGDFISCLVKDVQLIQEDRKL